MPNIQPVTVNDLKSVQVISRFCLRMILFTVWAAISSTDFARTFAALMLLSATLSLAAAIFRRESPFSPALTCWDEFAIYGMICTSIWMNAAGS